ncbi:unnamed protein product, partial [Symbiodinium pilosum]
VRKLGRRRKPKRPREEQAQDDGEYVEVPVEPNGRWLWVEDEPQEEVEHNELYPTEPSGPPPQWSEEPTEAEEPEEPQETEPQEEEPSTSSSSRP